MLSVQGNRVTSSGRRTEGKGRRDLVIMRKHAERLGFLGSVVIQLCLH